MSIEEIYFMMKSNFSRLAVLGLAVISGQVFAAVTLSGQVRLDATFPSKPNTTDTLELTRTRLHAKADLAADWHAGLRLDRAANNTVELRRAYVAWTGLENNTLTLGKSAHISTNADDTYYAPYITAHGVVAGFNTRDLGVSMAGSMGSFGYSLGVVNTNVDDNSNSLEWSFGGRAHFTPMKTDTMCWGLGVGFVDYKETDSFEANGTYFLTVPTTEPVLPAETEVTKSYTANFNKYTGMTADLSGAMGRFAGTLSYYHRKDKLANLTETEASVLYEGNTVTLVGADVDADFIPPAVTNPKTQSYCAELAYLVMGDGYNMDNAILTGPSFTDSALELGVRYSQFEREGAAIALAYHVPAVASVNTGFLTAKHKKRTFSVFANYYVNSNATIKLEYLDGNTKDGAGNLVTDYARDESGAVITGGEQRKISARAEFKF